MFSSLRRLPLLAFLVPALAMPAAAGAANGHHATGTHHHRSHSRARRPHLRFRAPVAHQTVSHRNRHVRCQVVVHSASRIRYVTFRLDGRRLNRERHAPFTCSNDHKGTLNATKLTPGSHTLQAVAVDADGQTSSTSVPVNVAPTPPTASASGSTGDASTPAPGSDGTTLWTGDLETGDFSQMYPAPWDIDQAPQPQIVTDNVRSGHYAEKFYMPPGGFREEQSPVNATTGEGMNFHEGDDLYYGFSFMLGAGWPTGPEWCVITQWHMDAAGGNEPTVGLSTDGGGFQLFRQPNYGQMTYWEQRPLITGRWIDFVVHIKFSSDPSVGFIELWEDGVKQTLVNGQTRMYTMTFGPGGQFGFWKHGIYRSQAITQPATLWADSMRIGTTYAAAAPR